MSHTKLRPFIVKVSPVLGYFPLERIRNCASIGLINVLRISR